MAVCCIFDFECLLCVFFFSKISNQYLLIFKVEMFTYLEVILIIFYHFHTSESVTHKTWILVKKFVFDQMFFWTTFRWTCNIIFFFIFCDAEAYARASKAFEHFLFFFIKYYCLLKFYVSSYKNLLITVVFQRHWCKLCFCCFFTSTGRLIFMPTS